MNTGPGHPFPPLLLSIPTDAITCAYTNDPDDPVRYASEGHLTIYGVHHEGFSHVILGISFMEDNLPGLERQVYYRCLEEGDTITLGKDYFEVTCTNHRNVRFCQSDLSIIWRIKFFRDELDSLRPWLTAVREGCWRTEDCIVTLDHADRDVLYYNLRATLVEQPIPERLGVLGHWQSPAPAGTPTRVQFPYMPERRPLRGRFRPTYPFQRQPNPTELAGTQPAQYPAQPQATKMAAAAEVLCEMQTVPEQPLHELEGSPGWGPRGDLGDAGEGSSSRAKGKQTERGQAPPAFVVSPLFVKVEPESPGAGEY